MEYKCLPSGLHGVREDLVYFVHGAYAGVSAFVLGDADEQQRNANFVAVGALVPLSFGRLGQSWIHAAALRELARERVRDAQRSQGLEQFWKENKGENSGDGTPVSPSAVRRASLPVTAIDANRKRKRATSDASGNMFPAMQALPPDHPAVSMFALLDMFGPLIFPLHRATLLRKRILLLTTPPVQESCNFVYLLSILSSIPRFLADSLPPESELALRIQTLFSVGVHDIPFLGDEKRRERWLACTTDDILEEKRDLYDVFVRLPSHAGSSHEWPRIRTTDGKDIRATQRDLRRYRLLRAELDRTVPAYQDDPEEASSDSGGASSPLMRASTNALVEEAKHTRPGDSTICEPVSWTAMAYNGFMWWASAGEVEAWENEEARADRQLLEELPEMEDLVQHMATSSSGDVQGGEPQVRLKMVAATVLTAYFHHMTADILQPLIDAVEEADDATEEGVADAAIHISNEDMRAMGLDSWSAADREFVAEALRLYFARESKIEEGGLNICGVRVC